MDLFNYQYCSQYCIATRCHGHSQFTNFSERIFHCISGQHCHCTSDSAESPGRYHRFKVWFKATDNPIYISFNRSIVITPRNLYEYVNDLRKRRRFHRLIYACLFCCMVFCMGLGIAIRICICSCGHLYRIASDNETMWATKTLVAASIY